jgi:hypothetical protein
VGAPKNPGCDVGKPRAKKQPYKDGGGTPLGDGYKSKEPAGKLVAEVNGKGEIEKREHGRVLGSGARR